jgi:putative FmdB family regulatory protein
MPTYEYICQKCNYEFEEFQSIKAEPIKICPKCKGPVIRKIGSGAGLLFKGSGFYITDYKKNKTSPTESTPKESKDSTAKTETKPEKEKSDAKKAS